MPPRSPSRPGDSARAHPQGAPQVVHPVGQLAAHRDVFMAHGDRDALVPAHHLLDLWPCEERPPASRWPPPRAGRRSSAASRQGSRDGGVVARPRPVSSAGTGSYRVDVGKVAARSDLTDDQLDDLARCVRAHCGRAHCGRASNDADGHPAPSLRSRRDPNRARRPRSRGEWPSAHGAYPDCRQPSAAKRPPAGLTFGRARATAVVRGESERVRSPVARSDVAPLQSRNRLSDPSV